MDAGIKMHTKSHFMCSGLRKGKRLFLCRTPLQAKICLTIIKKENNEDCDLIYLTRDDSDTDRSYFAQLREIVSNAFYLHLPNRMTYILSQILGIMRFRRQRQQNDYTKIYLASINCIIFRYIIKKNPQATLYGFDDGSANFTTDSIYYQTYRYNILNIYCILMGLPSVDKVKSLLQRHYSIYPGFGNIVEREKIYFISVFTSITPNTDFVRNDTVTFFIGQPFHEYLGVLQRESMKSWLSTQHVDYYVRHPREKTALLESIPMLNNDGLLAEEAIFKAVRDCRPRIIANYSTVLFNVSHHDADKIYLSIGDDAIERRRRALIRKTNSKIIRIGV